MLVLLNSYLTGREQETSVGKSFPMICRTREEKSGETGERTEMENMENSEQIRA